MSRKWIKKAAFIAAVSATALLSGCGGSGGQNGVGNIPGGVGAYPSGGCIPLEAPIPFTFTGARYTSMHKLIAGAVPGVPAGQLIIGGATTQGGNLQTPGGREAMITINMAAPPADGTFQDYAVNGSGTMFLRSDVIAGIRMKFGGMTGYTQPGAYPYPTGYPQTGYPQTGYYPQQPTQNVCVSGAAFILNVTNQGVLIGGSGNAMQDVFLYINGSSQGVTLTI